MSKVELPFDLEAHGLNRDQDFIYALYRWYTAQVPVLSAFSLWYLRDGQGENGEIYRSQTKSVPEVNPVLRFMHLSRSAGETLTSDISLRKAGSWVLGVQLLDGSVPSKPTDTFGETGTTARAVRAIDGLGDEFDLAAGRMRAALSKSARSYGNGMAWCLRGDDKNPATGATSLAALALCGEGPVDSELLSAVGHWLLSQQSSDGGWGEFSGAESTAHNTFNVLRTLCKLEDAGFILPSAYEAARQGADRWFTECDELGKGRIIDVGFEVRLGALLERQDTKAMDLVTSLAGRSGEALASSSDAYDTEMLGLALLEWSRFADQHNVSADWRWQLPALLPTFARSGTELYDVLYLVSPRRKWRRIIDWCVKHELVESVGGRIVGLVTALAVVDERAIRYLGKSGHTAVSWTVSLAIVVAAASWVLMRIRAASDWKGATSSLVVSAVLGAGIADVANAGVQEPLAQLTLARVAVAVLASLIVDAVSYTADRSGLISRFLPTG